MKNHKRITPWLVLGGLMLLVGAAIADYNVQNKGTYYDNASTGLRTDSNGRLLTSEAADLGTQTSGWLPLISDTTAVGIADSSAIQTAYSGYVLHGLMIRASLPAGGVPPFVRLAVSIRTHLNDTADSLSTAPVYPTRTLTAIAAGADSLKYGSTQVPTTVALEDGEFIVTLSRSHLGTANGAAWVTGIQRYVMLEAPGGSGPGYRLKNFSVRVRVLSSGANTNSITVNAYATMLR